jgi:hypothetical protein
MNSPTVCLALAIAIILTGCDSSQPQSTAPPAKPHYQRFMPIPADGFFTQGIPWHGYFALDTKTGMLCKTIVFPKDMPQWTNDVPSCSGIAARDTD